MGFFSWLRALLPRRRRPVPSTPLLTVKEMEKLIDDKDFEIAADLARRGMEKFPSSEAIPQKYRYVRKIQERNTLRKLRTKIKNNPDPYDYAKLGELYLELGDGDHAQEICLQGIEAFPTHEGCFIILGRLRLQRFYEDYIAKDGIKAIEYLERARDLNRNSYKPPLLLAALYMKIGAPQHAIMRCESILQFAPGDDRTQGVLQRAKQIEGPPREDIDLLLREYAERMVGEKNQDPDDSSMLAPFVQNPKKLQDILAFFSKVGGYQSSLAFTKEGSLLATHAVIDTEKDSLAENIHRVYRAAEHCSLRIDLGGIRSTLFESPTGFVYLFGFEMLYFCVICNPLAKTSELLGAASTFVEHEIYQALAV